MQDHRPSFTAAFVAACRGLSPLLSERSRLVDDPYGLLFAEPRVRALATTLRSLHGPARVAARAALLPLLPWVVYMQLRTRAIDDALRDFLAAGGAQVVLLGAGFDARAVRLLDVLGEARVFEVDHPATQAHKRAVFGSSGVVSGASYLAWDFERDALSALGARLEALGHDPSRPTLTIWEGVTMYLTAEALASSVEAVASYSAPASQLVFNYRLRASVEAPGLLGRAAARIVRRVGEPFRSGFDPATLPAWLAERGFTLRSDEDLSALATRLLPGSRAGLFRTGTHLALAERG